jgi:hypothetical protein
VLGERSVDGASGQGTGKGVDRQGAAELALGVNLPYRESHEVAPVWSLSELALESIPHKAPHLSFERYWF